MTVSAKRLNKLSRTAYRQGYLREMTVTWVIHQIKALRKQRGWSQADLGKRMDKPQSAVARCESESYGNWNVGTLLELANAFDVALEVRFVSWPRFMDSVSDTSEKAMSVPSFSRNHFLAANLYRSDLSLGNEQRLAATEPRQSSGHIGALLASKSGTTDVENQWKTSLFSLESPGAHFVQN